jgi:hypothetical protein
MTIYVYHIFITPQPNATVNWFFKPQLTNSYAVGVLSKHYPCYLKRSATQ